MQFQFESFAALIEMGGHGPYVWASYAVTLIGLVALMIYPLSKKRQLITQLRRQQRIDVAEAGNANVTS